MLFVAVFVPQKVFIDLFNIAPTKSHNQWKSREFFGKTMANMM